ncbi:small_GTP: small GTP-binding protein domain protein [Roseovarius mucosus]|uniref:Small_GTP: small GTP-binding protein domain protein n=1 Tax=Roseovarius mucosus TaxID=215743 RepID=A0A1V0RTG4_9RHOB|nr:GTPase domain-containing protein [Roseovarius mucosus]ARE85039.1 small_GTP: small GTP-binding protein domain protein [Roseovarius mucosus]
MSTRRRWRDFPGRLKKELEGTSAIAGVGGVGLGAAGWGILPPPFTFLFVGVGGAITLSVLAYAGYRAIPPKLLDPGDLVGNEIDLDELENRIQKIGKVAIIGRSQAGKTTLRNRLKFDVAKTVRTEELEATVIALPTAPVQFVALLDGDGTKYRQQLVMAEVCDFLIIILDHNSSDEDRTFDEDRVAKHKEFLEQVSNSISKYRAEKLRKIMFLWNKRDLWQRAEAEDSAKFEEFTASVFKKWSESNFAETVVQQPHFNEDASDVSFVMNAIIGFAKGGGYESRP